MVNYNGDNKLVQDQIVDNMHVQTTRELISDDILVQVDSIDNLIGTKCYVELILCLFCSCLRALLTMVSCASASSCATVISGPPAEQ